MKRSAKKFIGYAWAIAIVITIIITVWYSVSQYMEFVNFHTYIAVVNDSTNEIVWVGGGSLCAPGGPNLRVVGSCVQTSNDSYSCNGSYYKVSSNQIYCGYEVTPVNNSST